MPQQPSNDPSIGDRQNEVLRLELIKADVEMRLASARVELFKAQGGHLDFQITELPRQVGALMQLLNDRTSTSEVSKQPHTTPKAVNTQSSTAALSYPNAVSIGSGIAASIISSNKISPNNRPHNQTSFLSLKVSPDRYRNLVQKQELPSSSTSLAQGPDCGGHPRWGKTLPKAHESTKLTQLDSLSTNTDGQSFAPQPKSNEKVKANIDSPHILGDQIHDDTTTTTQETHNGRTIQTTPIVTTRSQSVHPQSGPTIYDSGTLVQPQRATTPHIPLSTQTESSSSGFRPPEIGPHNNAFLHLAAMHGLPSSTPHPQSAQQKHNLDHPNSTIPFPQINDIGWGGLTKKSKTTKDNTNVQNESDATVSRSNRSIIPQKRGPSVELVDERPMQRSRLGPDRVTTPPLNELNRPRKIDENYDDAEEAEESVSSQDDHSPTPRSTVTKQNDSNQNKSHTAKTGSKKAYTKKCQQYSSSPHVPQNSDSPYTYSSQSPPNPDFRAMISHVHNDEDYAEPESSRSMDPEVAIRHRRQQRAATRKQPGYYKSRTRNYLSPSERVTLELRFCAQVTKIIGSKICVSMPPLPYDTKPIFDRLASRFKRSDEAMTEEHYRSQQDFVADAKQILDLYVMLGHCPGCPFLKTGNARVMCYRMRLQSVLDQRMRDLKDALFACEVETEAEDHEGRCRIIDEWFWEEDFEEDSHWKGP